MDRIVTASAARGTVSLVAGITTHLVRDARERHDLAPTASAAVGRLLTAAALLGTSLKGRERLTLQIAGDGPLGKVTADAWSTGTHAVGARAYARNPSADVPLNGRGKFDVARVVGGGSLQVTKNYEVGHPYNGIVPLVSGEIGDDVAAYLANSEQIPSIVAVGVLADPRGIRAAGGVIAQVMPGADESTIATLERASQAMAPVTTQIVDGADPAALIDAVAGSLEVKLFDTYDVRFDCRCTREKVEIVLLGLGKDELAKLASEQPETEATCDFCGERYVLSADDVRALSARA
ncbi:33 kDa chaperonin [Vulcanimicrobium alpinum]|uniref:33 kDa chaperonin n=1 Tax=Vulcanimicrobium alpinum TaxID=3016050 RepID=A0AAN1XWX3_UNVUL|nr:Hsp33 family molecular chaperone HslO [Vulcanimicrobium alpinum]BDE06888.1 33 kDa chaperonin [Vulcanimicrobium alpinum]